jgi:hypothetical protein
LRKRVAAAQSAPTSNDGAQTLAAPWRIGSMIWRQSLVLGAAHLVSMASLRCCPPDAANYRLAASFGKIFLPIVVKGFVASL